MSKRRTIKVKELVDHVNSKLVNPGIDKYGKFTLSMLLESFLHETGNYAGYNHVFNWTEASDEEKKSRDYDRHYYYKGQTNEI